MVEEELMKARATEQDLRTAKDILAKRLEEEMGRQRHLDASADTSRTIRSEPVDVDDFDDEMRRKDEEIGSVRAELERKTNALPELNNAILNAREEADQELMQAKRALEMAQSEAENEKLTRLDAEGIISELREELDASEDAMAKLQRATVEAEKRADMLLSEVDELKELLEEAEKGLRISQEQIDTIQDENEALKEMLDDAAQTASLVQREINASVEEDVSLRAELDSLQELLAETEREANETKVAFEQELAATKEEVARSVAHRGMQQSEREKSLEEELTVMKKQMNAAEKILLDAKKQHEREWSERQKLEETLRNENVTLTKQLSEAQEKLKSESALSVKNVSLQTQATSLNGRLADLGTQLTSLETELMKKNEVEATLREAINTLRRRCALLQQKCPGVLKCEPDSSIDPDDILDAEVDRLNELLSVVSVDGSDDEDRALATRSIDRAEIDDMTRELEGRLHKAERARLAAEERLMATKETMHKVRTDAREALMKAEQKSMSEKKQLEERLEQHIEISESLRSDLGHIKEQLRMAGIKVGDMPQGKARVSFSSSEASEARDILVRSKAVSTGYREEISELKLLLDRVVKENEKMVCGQQELNELSNLKLQEASADLKRLARKRDKMNELKESIKSKCEAIMRIHEQQQELKEGKWIGPTDEVVGSVEKLY
jgi:chromosome segregation ATPase